MPRFFILALVPVLSFWAQVIRADPLDHWHLRQGPPTSSSLNAVAYGNGIFVAVGDGGTILTSSDQVNWFPRKSGTTQPLRAVAYGGGLFVVVGGSTDPTRRSVVLTSPDGITWLLRNNPGTSQELHSVVYGNGAFVVTGLTGTIVSSLDGITWSAQSSQTSADLYGIAYSGSLFIAVGRGGRIAWSVDGMTWTAGSAGTSTLLGIGYGAGNFVAVGESSILISSDGSQWRESPPRLSPSVYFGVAFHDNQFIAVGDGSTVVRLGEDFQCPALRRVGDGSSRLSSVAFGNGEYVAVGDGGLILRSRTGDTWTPLDASVPHLGEVVAAVAYGNGRFLTGSSTSPDGTEWFGRFSFPTFDSITFANGMFVGLGLTYDTAGKSVEAIFVSTNGTFWARRYLASDTNLRFRSTAYGNGRFVVVGEGRRALTSLDGVSWTQIALPVTDSGWGITFGNGTFVTVGRPNSALGSILNSKDGENWTVRRHNTSDGLSSITYGNGLFVAVGGNLLSGTGVILTSPDGVTWTSRGSGTPYYLLDVTYGDGVYAAVGGFDEVVTSIDGVNWVRRDARTGAALSAITFGNGTFVAAGGGQIVQSDPLVDSSPLIVHGPNSASLVPGEGALFRVLAAGTSPLSYQWLRDGVTIAGATNPVLSVANLQISDSANYSVAVSNLTGSVISQPAKLTVQAGYGDALDHWRWRNPLPQGNTLHSVVFGEGVFVAVGEGNTLVTSANGLNWDARQSDFVGALNAVTYGDGVFVAVGVNYQFGNIITSQIVTSQDGIHWARQSVCSADRLMAIAHGPHTFVALSDAGAIVTSRDGTNWTAQTSNGLSVLSGVTFGSNLFVAVGHTNFNDAIEELILTSTDGVQWQRRGPTTKGALADVVFGNGVFVARVFQNENNSGHVLTSPDGVNWSDSDLGLIGLPGSLSFLNGAFTSCFESSNGATVIYTSVDGVNWLRRSPIPFVSPNGISYGNGVYVAVGDAGLVSSSPNLGSWTKLLAGISGDLRDLAYGNGIYIAVGDGIWSTDGTSWRTNLAPGAMDLTGIAYGNGLFAAVGSGVDNNGRDLGTLFTSTGGDVWQTHGTNLPACRAIVAGNGLFVAVGDAGAIVISRDGQKWVVQSSPTTGSLWSVSFGNGKFVAAGESVVTSSNGVEWKLIPLELPHLLGGVVSAEEKVVIGVGGSWSSSIAFTSDDAVNWNEHVIAVGGEYVHSLAYGDGLFVAACKWGIFSSTDGENWRQRKLATDSGSDGHNLNAIRYVNGSFWALGPGGMILQAKSIISPRFRPESLQRLPEGAVGFVFDTDDGAGTVIEASSDLKTWGTLTNGVFQNGAMHVEDSAAAKLTRRFYRARVTKK